MNRITLGNRPETLAPRSRIEDFETETGVKIRVSIKLSEASGDRVVFDAQAFEIDANGMNLIGPDGRPSRTSSTYPVVSASSLASAATPDGTHTLNPGWVRIVGDYDQSTFEPTAVFAEGRPSGEPDWEINPTGQHYNTLTGVGYRWSEGEILRIAKGKVEELVGILANSAPIAGIDF